MNILIGCDPEVFVSKAGKYMSAYGMIPGTKKEPFVVEDGALQVDGMALEFNTNPASTKEQFLHNVQSVFAKLQSMIPAEYKIEIKPAISFDADYLKEQPKEALELGCDPDFNAYTGEANLPPDAASNMRTASGHIHIGWTKDADVTDVDHIYHCERLVKELDWYLALPSLWLDPDTTRKMMYGKAGAYRPKPYGVEYRVLSNFWLRSPLAMQWVFDTVHHCISQMGNGIVKQDNKNYNMEGLLSINSSGEPNYPTTWWDYNYPDKVKEIHTPQFVEVMKSLRA